MVRSILSASLVRPAWQWGPARVEGPDEDTFTLGVAALIRLGRQLMGTRARALRLHLVGYYPPEVEWAFSEALGISGLEVRLHPPTSPGFWGALAAAAHDEGTAMREAVVAADAAFPSAGTLRDRTIQRGAGAAAFLFGNDPGLAVLQHGFRGHPVGHAPSMHEVIADWMEALGLPPGGARGEVVLEAEEEPHRWLAAWERAAPGITVTLADSTTSGVESAPPIKGALLLWELARRLRSGDTGVVGQAGRGRNGYAAFRLDGPVRWAGSWGASEPGLPPPSGKFLDREVRLDTVSEGAYLPHPTYLENLAARWRLVGERCGRCQVLTFPPRGRCASCGESGKLHGESLARAGLVVEAVTTISPGAQPTEFDSMVETMGSYDVAVVRLEGRTRATLQVTDAVAGRLRVGDRVGVVLRRLYPMEGEWRYGLKAVPETPVGPPKAKGPNIRGPATRAARKPSSAAPKERPATLRGGAARVARPRRRAR